LSQAISLVAGGPVPSRRPDVRLDIADVVCGSFVMHFRRLVVDLGA
jgi:hypothetical protein